MLRRVALALRYVAAAAPVQCATAVRMLLVLLLLASLEASVVVVLAYSLVELLTLTWSTSQPRSSVLQR